MLVMESSFRLGTGKPHFLMPNTNCGGLVDHSLELCHCCLPAALLNNPLVTLAVSRKMLKKVAAAPSSDVMSTLIARMCMAQVNSPLNSSMRATCTGTEHNIRITEAAAMTRSAHAHHDVMISFTRGFFSYQNCGHFPHILDEI